MPGAISGTAPGARGPLLGLLSTLSVLTVLLSFCLLIHYSIGQPLAVHTYKGDRISPGHGLTHSRSQLSADKTSNRQREARGGGARV